MMFLGRQGWVVCMFPEVHQCADALLALTVSIPDEFQPMAASTLPGAFFVHNCEVSALPLRPDSQDVAQNGHVRFATQEAKAKLC